MTEHECFSIICQTGSKRKTGLAGQLNTTVEGCVHVSAHAHTHTANIHLFVRVCASTKSTKQRSVYPKCLNYLLQMRRPESTDKVRTSSEGVEVSLYTAETITALQPGCM